MRIVAILLALAACGGPKPKGESSIVPEGSDTSDHCCCKSTPLTSEDGQPVLEMTGRMECSTKPGECVTEVQCSLKNGGAAPTGSTPPPPPSGTSEPAVP